MNRPTNAGDLWLFIKDYFGLMLPDKVWTPGHSSPFGLVADAFLHPRQDLAA